MTTATIKSGRKSLDTPDVVREVPRGRLEFVHVGDRSLARITLQPGWKWSEHIQPTAQTESCQARHYQYVMRGRLTVQMDDGEQFELRAGDFAVITPGHNAWVSGSEPFVCIDYSPDMTAYAEEGHEHHQQ